MSFSFVPDERGRSRIVISGERDYIVPLEIAPLGLEDFLKRGKWKCVAMSVWSLHDINAGSQAVERIKARGGIIKLGLRPVNLPEENQHWIPGVRCDSAIDHTDVSRTEEDGIVKLRIIGSPEASPVWVTFSEGNVVDLRYGLLTDAEIDALISNVLSA